MGSVKVPNAYFKRYFSWNVDVEEVHLSMSGHEFPWNEHRNRLEMVASQTYPGASRQLKCCKPCHLPPLE